MKAKKRALLDSSICKHNGFRGLCKDPNEKHFVQIWFPGAFKDMRFLKSCYTTSGK